MEDAGEGTGISEATRKTCKRVREERKTAAATDSGSFGRYEKRKMGKDSSGSSGRPIHIRLGSNILKARKNMDHTSWLT